MEFWYVDVIFFPNLGSGYMGGWSLRKFMTTDSQDLCTFLYIKYASVKIKKKCYFDEGRKKGKKKRGKEKSK